MRAFSLIATLFIGFPLTAFALSLALSNRADAGLRVWPFTGEVTGEAGWLMAAMLGIGFLAGALFATVLAQPGRYRHWQTQRRLERAEKDLKNAEEKLALQGGATRADASPAPVQAIVADAESAALRF